MVISRKGRWWGAVLVFLGAWGLYALTSAPGTVFGDPAEYQFIPAIWGIAHPPGYAFYILLAGVWQRVFVVGSVAWRTNLLAGAAGAWSVSRVFLMVLDVGAHEGEAVGGNFALWLSAVMAALSLTGAADVWQHSIHSNAHIVSLAITMTQVWLLVRWWRTDKDGWLFALAFFCGIGVTHHPITIWGLPAYAIFIIVNRPKIFVQPRTWVPFLISGFAGLLPWLYFPLRSPDVPFGPTDMATWEGFLRHATAQGLRVNLFHFGLAEQWGRLRVFWTLLRLQYAWSLVVLLFIGAVALVRRRPKLALLYGLFLAGHLAFTLNSVQDVMAYLLHVFGGLAVFMGMGVLTVMTYLLAHPKVLPYKRWMRPACALMLLFVPVSTLITRYPRISMRDWDDADVFFAHLLTRFEGQAENAALVSDWEHLTPYFYHTYVADVRVDEADLRPVYVTGSLPWSEAVFGNLPRGPVYLSNYRRDIRDLGFRLRPVGDLWQVVEPRSSVPVAPQYPLTEVWVDGRVQVVGYDLPVTMVRPGDVLPVILYGRVAATQTEILMPWARLGDVEQRWATDSRRLTPAWLPGEVIAERYEVFVPYGLVPGTYPLSLGYTDMTSGVGAVAFADGQATLTLGAVLVEPHSAAVRQVRVLERALSNVGNDVALFDAWARVGLTMRHGVWTEPLSLQAGGSLHLTLKWHVLARPRMSYTVFIHLIDAAGQPWMGHDYTPLGGAFPSYLWFPKWLAGQQVVDPYRLVLPSHVPPGHYWLEVGMYEMGSVRRIPQLDFAGTMVGDRFILGPVDVVP